MTKGGDLVAIALAHGLVIDLTITMDIFAGGAISGASMNPARTLGPGLVENVWTAGWVYWVGPIVGAMIAALPYTYFLLDESVKNAPVDLPQQ